MKLLGYILDENDYEIVPTMNRQMVTLEIETNKIYNDVIFEPVKRGNSLTFNFLFKAKSEPKFSFVSQYGAYITQLKDVVEINRIVISINGSVVFDGTVLITPITINSSDTVMIRIYKNFYSNGSFRLIGSSL